MSGQSRYLVVSGPYGMSPEVDGVTDLTPANTRFRNINITGTLTGTFAPTLPFKLGPAPNATGVIDIDPSGFGGQYLDVVNGADELQLALLGGTAFFQGGPTVGLSFGAGNQAKWVIPLTATVSRLVAQQVTCEIVGGSTNGFTVRNSGDTRNNLAVIDAGTVASLNDGSTSVNMQTAKAASGEVPGGPAITPGQNNKNFSLVAAGAVATVSGILGLYYSDGTQFRSAVEIASVAAFPGTLKIMRAGGQVQQGGGATNALSTSTLISQATGLANAVATAVVTVTIPNAAHSASIELSLTASLGAGGAIGANEASATTDYQIVVTRTAGVNATAVISAAIGGAACLVAGANTCTVAAVLSAMAGAVGAPNTFTINVTVTRGGGASTNHTCLIVARVENANATGVTIA